MYPDPDVEQFVTAYLAGGYVPEDLFGTVFKRLEPSTGPTSLRSISSWDTRTSAYDPAKINNIGFGYGLWAHHLYWLLHDGYTTRPANVTDDKAKKRLQINPCTWSTEGGGRHEGVSLTFKGGGMGPVMPDEGWSDGIKTNHYAVEVPDPEDWLPGGGKAGGPGNLHPVDVHFWFHNIRVNAGVRLEAWLEEQKGK